jgi:glycosyltransferase involved in cell wall biosynthesis
MKGGIRTLGTEKKSRLNNPLISVITVVLNGEKHLEQTIQSVLTQSYNNIEYIIIDGQSTDKTLEIIKKYENKIDYWSSEKDGGIYYAMNKGIAHANGDIIGILNADDFYSSDAILNIVDAFLKTNADVFHGDILLLNNKHETRMQPDIHKMMEQPSVFHPTCFVKKQVYSRIGDFNTDYKISADYDFLLRCLKSNVKFEYIPQALTYFRPGGMSASCASNLEGYKIMKIHQTGFHKAVLWRALKCYIKTFIKKVINLGKQ